MGWLEYVARKYYPSPVPTALSLGCGGGGPERHGLQLQIAEKPEAFDVSEDALQIAKEEEQNSGYLDSINYTVENLSKLDFVENSYDAVFASQSVNYSEALEHYMQQVSWCLKLVAISSSTNS